MQASVRLIETPEGMAFEGRTEAGHKVVMGVAAEVGGADAGPRPMEMLLLGLGGCSGVDVVHILRRGRHAVADCRVEVEALRAAQPPQVFETIHLVFHLEGEGLTQAAAERAARLSAEKYCSASIMLGASARVTHEVRVAGTGPAAQA